MPEHSIRRDHEAVQLGRLVALQGDWHVPISKDPVLRATVRILRRRGYAGLTTKDVIRSAHVGRSEFYRRFTSKHDCFLEAYDALLDDVDARVAETEFDERDVSFTAVESWLSALARILAADHRTARILVMEVGHAERRSISGYVHDGILERLDDEPSATAMTLAVGAIVEVLRSSLVNEQLSTADEDELPRRVRDAVTTCFPSELLGGPRTSLLEPRGQLLDFNTAARRAR